MSISLFFSLLVALIQATTEYLKLKNKSFYYDIEQKSLDRQARLKTEWEKLRAAGDQQSASDADDVLQQLLAEKAARKHFSTLNSEA